ASPELHPHILKDVRLLLGREMVAANARLHQGAVPPHECLPARVVASEAPSDNDAVVGVAASEISDHRAHSKARPDCIRKPATAPACEPAGPWADSIATQHLF